MAIKGARTVAEYVIRSWIEENFDMEYTLTMDGNKGTLTDPYGDSLVLIYDLDSKSVCVI